MKDSMTIITKKRKDLSFDYNNEDISYITTIPDAACSSNCFVKITGGDEKNIALLLYKAMQLHDQWSAKTA